MWDIKWSGSGTRTHPDQLTASHVGDFGTPVGVVIAQALESGLQLNPSRMLSGAELSQLYTAGKTKTRDKDSAFSKRVAQVVKQIQQQEKISPEVYNAWQTVCMSSRREQQEVFKRLDVTVEEKGESFYANMLPQVLQDLNDKKLLHIHDGANTILIPDGKKDIPFIIQKSDGGWLYSSTDLAALKYRIEQGNQWIIYVTDDSQSHHFQQVFKVCTRL